MSHLLPISETPLVSIVIPMLNEVEAIERCILSILQQDYPKGKIQILVVDGLSTDGSREIVRKLSVENNDQIKLLDNPDKATPKALNIGVKNAEGQVVIILGAHTKINRDFIKLNIKYMHEMGVNCTGGTQENVGDTLIQQAIGDGMSSIFGMPSAPYRFKTKKGYVDTVVYAAYKKALFDEIGYFDEELHISEDAELNWRIRQAGHKIYYTPEIVSFYYPRKNLNRLFKQFFNYGILRSNVIKKHLDAFKIIHVIPPLFVFLLLVLLVLSFFSSLFCTIFLTMVAIYLLYIVIASIYTAIYKKRIINVLLLPFVFLTMHFSWGTGFLVGLFKTYN